MNDLLLHLLNIYIDKGDPPDVLSIECPDDTPVISFGWLTGDSIIYGYTKDRWDIVWTRFNEFWQKTTNVNF